MAFKFFSRSYYIYSATQNWGSGSARETTRGRRSHASSLHLFIIHCASFSPFHIVCLLDFSIDVCFPFFVENERKTATAQQGVYAFFVSTWAALCLFCWEPFNEKRRRSRMLAIRLYICVFCYSWGGCVNCTLFGSALLMSLNLCNTMNCYLMHFLSRARVLSRLSMQYTFAVCLSGDDIPDS